MSDRVALGELSDVELLAEHTSGHPDAFGELVRRHRDRLWAVALRVTGNHEEAADALQDALVSAFRASGGSPGGASFRGDAAVTTWLHRIVVNACLDRLRRARARPVVPLPDELPPAPGDPYADEDTALLVHGALATLPPEQRAALVLVDLHGWPVDEAARILGVPSGTVKSRCARGRARLLPLLSAGRSGTYDAPGPVPSPVAVPARRQPGPPDGNRRPPGAVPAASVAASDPAPTPAAPAPAPAPAPAAGRSGEEARP